VTFAKPRKYAAVSVYALSTLLILSAFATANADLIVTPTVDTSALSSAVKGSGVINVTASIMHGVDSQFGTYAGFSKTPITIGNGIVLSSGNVADVVGPAQSSDFPATDLAGSGTPEFDAYGPGHIPNFQSSFDVAALLINFELNAPSQIQFDLVFGSIEFPNWVNQYSDSVLAFLDGTNQQIIFDSKGNPIDVGSSFASLVSTKDVNSAFGGPHGVLGITTTSGLLSAGTHSLLFEVGDVNDHILDSAAFISNLRTGTGTEGSTINDPGEYELHGVPEPSSFALMALGGIGLAVGAYRRRH